MAKDIIDTIMNPSRQRILQYLLLHEKATAKEIAKELIDIPQASLYRHIKALREAELLNIVEEKSVRGTIEKTYALGQPKIDPTNANIAMIIQNTLLSIMGSFHRYFQQENVNPVEDMISVNTVTLLLSDEEFGELYQEIGELYQKRLENTLKEGRKQRNISFISAPITEKEGGQ